MKKNKILSLHKHDQNNLKMFGRGLITPDELTNRSRIIYRNFSKIVKQYGFPKHNESISEGEIYKASVVLLLHVPVSKMREIYESIKGFKDNELLPQDRAYIVDKMLVISKKRQIYGTQFNRVGNKILFFPIRDEENVNKLRKKINLCTLSQYIKFIKGRRKSVLRENIQ